MILSRERRQKMGSDKIVSDKKSVASGKAASHQLVTLFGAQSLKRREACAAVAGFVPYGCWRVFHDPVAGGRENGVIFDHHNARAVTL